MVTWGLKNLIYMSQMGQNATFPVFRLLPVSYCLFPCFLSSLLLLCNDVIFLLTAKEVWDSLSDTYAADQNVNRIYQLCEELFVAKQHDKSLPFFYSYIKGRWEEPNLYPPYPTSVDEWKKQREKWKVLTFLSGLNSEYASARSQMLTGSALPSLNVAFSRLSRLGIDSSLATSVPHKSALLSAGRGSNSTPTLPSGRGQGRGSGGGRGQGGGRGRGRGVSDIRHCDFCNTDGHIEDFFWVKYGKPAWAKQLTAATGSTSGGTPTDPAPHSSAGGSVSLSREDFDRLLRLAQREPSPPGPSATLANAGISSAPVSNKSSSWIIDSGASDHMTGTLSSLTSFNRFSSFMNVQLADGRVSPGHGTVSPVPSLFLSSVLFVPHFPMSLLSISQFTLYGNCSVTFFPFVCFRIWQPRR